MPIIINWMERGDSEEEFINIPTSAGVLRIYHYDNVITKTEWYFGSAIDSRLKNKWVTDLSANLNNQSDCLTLNLQKQGSVFRCKVWNEICKIPTGQVISYSQLAKQIGSGARAVANACRDNPFPGIIPCHRVVSKSGLGGYMGKTSGKSLEIKKMLLASETNNIVYGK
ncbi:MAG: MGMT family protein [Methylococcales symbiont of Iophon sp. n. MRB-2018]|nr:MAG: MGMT family protein [Methylococcales symbiont of Iophon sp. n. MRB-2018]KAF3980036.1 MAG: MGMT family protein [Methylococcales symbiont of Iophon sp. n. MRB-2018]